METKIFDWKNKINDEELAQVIETINNNGLVIFPTDTVYGLACNCFSKEAINKIFEIKKRDKGKPINLLTNSVEKIHMVTDNISEKELKLIKKYMPGALTIIFNKNNMTPDILTSGLKTIGVRIPNNEIALKILEKIEYPLATTSANLSGEDAGTEIDNFKNIFNGKVDIIIDGGESDLKKASTIIRVEDDKIITLREGNIKITD